MYVMKTLTFTKFRLYTPFVINVPQIISDCVFVYLLACKTGNKNKGKTNGHIVLVNCQGGWFSKERCGYDNVLSVAVSTGRRFTTIPCRTFGFRDFAVFYFISLVTKCSR